MIKNCKNMSNRHRRTRIYGANYDIGESYYKEQLNELDNKRSINRNHDSPLEMDTKKQSKLGPKVTFLSEDINENTSHVMRNFNLNNINDAEHIIPGLSIYKPGDLDTSNKVNAHDLKDECLTKQRYFKNFMPNDFDYDEEYIKSSPKTSRDISIENDKYHKLFGKNSRRFFGEDDAELKIAFNLEKKATSHITLPSECVSGNNIRKENNIEGEDAFSRANASKARLLDLEEQIMSITNKQNEREKRTQNLKKILSEVTSHNKLV